MEQAWLTVDELAAVLKVSPKSIRRAYRKGEIPVDRFCRFVRFDLERVKEALKAKGDRPSFVLPKKTVGQRSATGGASRRRAQQTRPRLGKTGASIAQTPRRKK
ncbi:MAG TPA: helix-turn-helix domain-containing protein [Nitrospira sp.]|jgi:excisionase family DNA binding protein|nr:helix-turn-helix domain-containing protein [Nitrospira sp.]HQY58931.1 helix-turn-helix domain-containing protein [Nitrospira sp.]HRA98656.1 helix-turn-helix domain-containing protein [Nitrospira sp.]